MPTVLMVEPPLRLSRDFIDAPYYVGLGLYQAAAVLRDCGWRVQVADALARPDADFLLEGDVAWLGAPRDAFLEDLAPAGADLVMVHTTPYLLGDVGRPWLGELVARLRRKIGLPIVLAELFTGGTHYLEYDARALLQSLPEVQLLLRYEGESLLRRLAGEWPIVLDDASRVWENHDSFELDTQPAPAFDLMDAPAFFEFQNRTLGARWRPGPFPAEPARTLPVTTARGCPYGCSFCSKNPGLPGDRRQYRTIPLARIEQWLKDWRRRFDLERLVVMDELANLDPGRFDAILDLLERYHLRVEFPNGLRADCITEAQVRRLARLTSRLKVSLESASRRVQDDVLDKRLDPDAVRLVADWCAAHDLPLDVHLLIGVPGESASDIRATLAMAYQLHETTRARPLVQFAVPLPGTRLFEVCREGRYTVATTPDLAAAFQRRGIVATEVFDPASLAQARRQLERRLSQSQNRKVIVNLTYQCNNRCRFCAVGDRPRRHADVARVVSLLAGYRDQGYEHLDIDGGEPTLHEGLFDLVRTARDQGFSRVTLVTNGRRLSYPAYAEGLARSGVTGLLVSLHAAERAIHEQLTGVQGSFDQTVAGLRNLLRLPRLAERVAVNTTLVQENLGGLVPLGRKLSEWGVHRWNLQAVTPFGRGRDAQLPSAAIWTERVTEVLERAPPDLLIQVINCPPCLLPGHEDAAAADFDKASRDMVFVDETGENLQQFLAGRRRHTARCEACLLAWDCPGEYAFLPPDGGEG